MGVSYQLKVELAGSHPRVWRRIIVPANTPFDNLNAIIQIVMGWTEDHPFEFTANGVKIYDFGPEPDPGNNPKERDAMDSTLDELVTMVDTRFTYTYNAHDRWVHEIRLEKILRRNQNNPICVAGEGVCSPVKQLPGSEDFFDMNEVNSGLMGYAGEWDEIHDEAGRIIGELERERDDDDADADAEEEK